MKRSTRQKEKSLKIHQKNKNNFLNNACPFDYIYCMKKMQLWFRQSRLTRQIAYWYWINFLANDTDLDSYLLWQLGYKWR